MVYNIVNYFILFYFLNLDRDLLSKYMKSFLGVSTECVQDIFGPIGKRNGKVKSVDDNFGDVQRQPLIVSSIGIVIFENSSKKRQIR